MSEHIVRALQGRVFRASIVKKNRYLARLRIYGALESANQIVSRACLSRVVAKRASLAGQVLLREWYKKRPLVANEDRTQPSELIISCVIIFAIEAVNSLSVPSAYLEQDAKQRGGCPSPRNSFFTKRKYIVGKKTFVSFFGYFLCYLGVNLRETWKKFTEHNVYLRTMAILE